MAVYPKPNYTQSSIKDYNGVHFFTYLPPQGQNNDAASVSTPPTQEFWNKFFKHPYITYCCKIKSGNFLNDTNVYVNQPPGSPSYQVNNIYQSEINAQAMAKRYADWFEYMGFTLDRATLFTPTGILPDGTEAYFSGAIHLAQFGQYGGNFDVSKRSLFYNSNLPAGRQGDPFEFGDNGNLPYCFGHHTKATLRNRPESSTHGYTLGDFAKKVFQYLKAECDRRRLMYPLFIINDNEEMISAGGVMINANYPETPTDVNGLSRIASALVGSYKGHPNGPTYLGVLNEAYLRNQTFNEPVYYDWNGSSWVEKTLLEGLREHGIQVVGPNQNQFPSTEWLTGSSPTSLSNWFTAGPIVRPADNFVSGYANQERSAISSTNIGFDYRNQIFVKKLNSLYMKIADHGMSKVLYEPAKEVFGDTIQCGNRGIISVLDHTARFYDSGNVWNKIPFSSSPRGKPLLRADFSCPSLFGPNQPNPPDVISSIDTSTNPPTTRRRAATPNDFKYDRRSNRYLNDRRVGGTPDDPYGSYGNTVWGTYFHAFGTTRSEIFRNFAIHQVRACKAGNNPSPIIPMLALPFDTWNGYTITPHDIYEVLKGHYSLGVRQWLIYNETSPAGWSHPEYSPNNYGYATRIEWFVAVVDTFLYWFYHRRDPERMFGFEDDDLYNTIRGFNQKTIGGGGRPLGFGLSVQRAKARGPE